MKRGAVGNQGRTHKTWGPCNNIPEALVQDILGHWPGERRMEEEDYECQVPKADFRCQEE